MSTFPRVRTVSHGSSEVLMKPTVEANKVAAANENKPLIPSKPHEVIHRQALDALKAMGIQNPDQIAVRGQYVVQFGKYRGQTFRWMLENDMGYSSYLVVNMEREGGNMPNTTLGHNKFHFKAYVQSVPGGRRGVQQKKLQGSRVLLKRVQLPKTKPSTSTSAVKEEMDDEEFLSVCEALESSQEEVHAPTPAKVARTEPRKSLPVPTPPKSKLQELRGVPQGLGLVSPKEDKYPLLDGWRHTLDETDRHWVSQALFRYGTSNKVELNPAKLTQMWFYPPQPSLTTNQVPKVDRYFARRFFLWMPYRLWKVVFRCPTPECDNNMLTSAGLYPRVRRVVDVSDYYYLGTEYLQCNKCGKRLIGWSEVLLNQLDVGHRYQFPALLTYRKACDVRVVTMMRQRGLGNSSTQLERKLEELHSEAWLRRSAHYLADCQGYAEASTRKLLLRPEFESVPAQPPVPRYRWLQDVYCYDVMRRIEEVKAAITSTFGRVLKLDSTKKVVKKLAGRSADTAAWATNIGNEDGQVLMSVLTASEGYGLGPMVAGIVQRYSSAGIPPPVVLYVDRDCCGASSVRRMFAAWPDVEVRLDIWHFMRRFTAGCTTDAHQLYSVFMSRLTKCIFEWSSDDVQTLREAKRTELLQRLVEAPTDSDVVRQLTKRELALHCRRRTRGTDETTRLIGDLMEAFMGDQGRDTLGVPLFDKERIAHIWESQKRHVACIQDPDRFQLYTQTGLLKKGTERIPTYRCARGSTSLESFHLHLARFIPGTSASDVHFQAYLLEGLVRWNEDRAKEAVTRDIPGPSSYSGLLRHAVNDLSNRVLDRKLVPEYQPPRKYTGELIGVEYLFSQTGQVLQEFSLDPDDEDTAQFDTADTDEEDEDQPDEGFQDATDVEDQTVPPVDVPPPAAPAPVVSPVRPTPPTPERDTTGAGPSTPPALPIGDNQLDDLDPLDSVGPDNIGGFHKVEALAGYLFSLRDQSRALTNDQATHIVRLWNELSEYDKRPSKLEPIHRPAIKTGRFKSKSATTVVPGVDSTKRCFLGQNAGPAQKPTSNRYMEALILRLCSAYPSPVKEGKKTTQRWTLVTAAYKAIREMILSNAIIMDQTHLTLLEINHRNLTVWYNARLKAQERQMLEQGLRLPLPPMTASGSLPTARVRLPATHVTPVPPDQQHQFDMPPITVGTSVSRRRLFTPPSETPANPESTYQRTSSGTSSSLQPVAPKPTEPPGSSLQPPSDVPRTTVWYQKKVQKKKLAGELVRTNTQRREHRTFTCKQCGQLRTSERHTQYYGSWYCADKETLTFEEWRSSREKCRLERKQQKQQQQQQEQQQPDDDQQ